MYKIYKIYRVYAKFTQSSTENNGSLDTHARSAKRIPIEQKNYAK